MDLAPQEIAVLGLLMDGPSHGYALRERLKGTLARIAPLQGGTLYYTLDKLEKRGLVEGKGHAREGRRPRRRICAITAAGKRAFRKAALRLFEPEFRPFYPMHLAVWFRRHLDDADLAGAMAARRDSLREYADKVTAGEVRAGDRPEVAWLLDHVGRSVTATADWLDAVLEDIDR